MKRAGVLILAAAALAASVAAAPAPQAQVHDAVIRADAAPRTLAEFGFFTDAAGRQPAARVTPYELNVPLWSDGADKLRYIYLPEGTGLVADGEGLLRFPVGAAIIKSFAFGMTLRYQF